jgi:hypothetical protein
MCVVDDAQERLTRRGRGHEVESGQPDDIAVRRISRSEPECDPQRLALRVRQPCDLVEQRPAELVQTRVREIELALDADGTKNVETCCSGRNVIEERRFADARLTADDERATPAAARRSKQPLQLRQLRSAADDCARQVGRR